MMDIQPWEPGRDGKAALYGSIDHPALATWVVDGYGNPHHYEVMGDAGIGNFMAMDIDPDGGLSLLFGDPSSPAEAAKLDPRLHVKSRGPLAEDWTFSKLHRATEDMHNWEPGTWGKGFVLTDGTPVTWSLQEGRQRPGFENDPSPLAQGPHHDDYAREIGLGRNPDGYDEFDPDAGGWNTPVYIKPNGEVNTMGHWPDADSVGIQPFLDLGLKAPRSDEGEWHFGSSVWQPGGYGKAFVTQEGEVHSWPIVNGYPGHAVKARELGVVRPRSYFEIEPDGTIFRALGQREGDGELVAQATGGHVAPQADWNFSKLATGGFAQDPNKCSTCGSTALTPSKSMGYKTYRTCMNCGRSQLTGLHFNDRGQPCSCGFTKHIDPIAENLDATSSWSFDTLSRGFDPKTASKLHDFLMNPKSRPDLQNEESQGFLKHLAEHYHNDKTDALMPWLTREWKKGRVHYSGLNPSDPSLRTLVDGGGYDQTERFTPNDLNHWADFYRSSHPLKREMGDIMQHDVHSFGQRVRDWDDDMLRRAEEKENEKRLIHGGHVVHTTPDGWTIRNLTTPEELTAEGDAMGHCVGGYHNEVADGRSIIHSLRDPQGKPHATIEYEPTMHVDGRGDLIDPNEHHGRCPSCGATDEYQGGRCWSCGYPFDPTPRHSNVVQIQGKGNEAPKPEYQERIKHYFTHGFGDEDRPSIGYGTIDHIGDIHEAANDDGLYRYDEHLQGDYGLKDGRDVMWPQLVDSLVRQPRHRQSDWDYHHDEGQTVYDLARERQQIPEFAKAVEENAQKWQDSFDEWREMNREHAVPYPSEADEDSPEMQAYYDDEGEWAAEHPGMQASNHLYGLLSPHWHQPSGQPAGYYNMLSTFSKQAALTTQQLLRKRDMWDQTLGPDQAPIHHEFPDGWSIRKLNTNHAECYEGEMMPNCVGSADALLNRTPQDQWHEPAQIGSNPDYTYYSVRDPHNIPHATFAHDPDEKHQSFWGLGLEGRAGSNASRYAPYVHDWWVNKMGGRPADPEAWEDEFGEDMHAVGSPEHTNSEAHPKLYSENPPVPWWARDTMGGMPERMRRAIKPHKKAMEITDDAQAEQFLRSKLVHHYTADDVDKLVEDFHRHRSELAKHTEKYSPEAVKPYVRKEFPEFYWMHGSYGPAVYNTIKKFQEIHKGTYWNHPGVWRGSLVSDLISEADVDPSTAEHIADQWVTGHLKGHSDTPQVKRQTITDEKANEMADIMQVPKDKREQMLERIRNLHTEYVPDPEHDPAQVWKIPAPRHASEASWSFAKIPPLPTAEEMARGRDCYFHPGVPAVAAEGFAAMCPSCLQSYRTHQRVDLLPSAPDHVQIGNDTSALAKVADFDPEGWLPAPNWKPGSGHGKFIVTPESKIYAWQTTADSHHTEADGYPSHSEYLDAHRELDHAHAVDDLWSDAPQYTFGWIYPDGRLDGVKAAVNRDKHMKLIEHYVPGTKAPDGKSDWHFAAQDMERRGAIGEGWAKAIKLKDGRWIEWPTTGYDQRPSHWEKIDEHNIDDSQVEYLAERAPGQDWASWEQGEPGPGEDYWHFASSELTPIDGWRTPKGYPPYVEGNYGRYVRQKDGTTWAWDAEHPDSPEHSELYEQLGPHTIKGIRYIGVDGQDDAKTWHFATSNGLIFQQLADPKCKVCYGMGGMMGDDGIEYPCYRCVAGKVPGPQRWDARQDELGHKEIKQRQRDMAQIPGRDLRDEYPIDPNPWQLRLEGGARRAAPSEILEPWVEGRHGKGLVLKDGTKHTWATDAPEGDGWPGHGTAADELGLTREQVDHALWVDPDGTEHHENEQGLHWVFANMTDLTSTSNPPNEVDTPLAPTSSTSTEGSSRPLDPLPAEHDSGTYAHELEEMLRGISEPTTATLSHGDSASGPALLSRGANSLDGLRMREAIPQYHRVVKMKDGTLHWEDEVLDASHGHMIKRIGLDPTQVADMGYTYRDGVVDWYGRPQHWNFGPLAHQQTHVKDNRPSFREFPIVEGIREAFEISESRNRKAYHNSGLGVSVIGAGWTPGETRKFLLGEKPGENATWDHAEEFHHSDVAHHLYGAGHQWAGQPADGWIDPEGNAEIYWTPDHWTPEFTQQRLHEIHPALKMQGQGDVWKFGHRGPRHQADGSSQIPVRWGGNPEAADKDLMEEHPVIYTKGQMTIGHAGLHHRDIHPKPFGPGIHAGVIMPNMGQIEWFSDVPDRAALTQAASKHMGVHLEDAHEGKDEEGEWKFGSGPDVADNVVNGNHHITNYLGADTDQRTAPWKPGLMGKGALIDGKLHLWAYGTPQDEWPYTDSSQYFDPHHDGMYDHIKGGYIDDIDADQKGEYWKGYTDMPKVFVGADGVLSSARSMGGDVAELDQIAAMHPQLKTHDEGEWHFGADLAQHNGVHIVTLHPDEIREPDEHWTMPDRLLNRVPFVYHPDDNEVVVGPPGVFHSQIDPNGHGHHGWVLDSSRGREIDFLRRENFPPPVRQALTDHFGVPLKDEGWHFGAVAHSLAWIPGEWGKALVLEDGSVHTWNQDEDGAPHHNEYVNMHGISQGAAEFGITPEGYVETYIGTHEDLQELLAVDPRLKVEHPDEWHFGSTSNVVWHGDEPGYVGDHSWIYHKPSETLHMGSPFMHHDDIYHQTASPEEYKEWEHPDYVFGAFNIDGRLEVYPNNPGDENYAQKISEIAKQNRWEHHMAPRGDEWHFGAHGWPLAEPRAQLHFPEGFEVGTNRAPFVYTVHDQDPNDVHVYFGHPGSEHGDITDPAGSQYSYQQQQMIERPAMHPGLYEAINGFAPHREWIGGYGSIKPRSFYTGDPEDNERNLEFYTVHEPRVMGTVAEAIQAHPPFGLKPGGFRNEPKQQYKPWEDEYHFEGSARPEAQHDSHGTDDAQRHAERNVPVPVWSDDWPDIGYDDHGSDKPHRNAQDGKHNHVPIVADYKEELIKRYQDQLPTPDPRYKFPNDPVRLEEIQPWAPGQYGKFVGYNDGTFKAWRNQPNPYDDDPAYVRDGWPSHYEVGLALGRGGTVENATQGYIAPDGRVYVISTANNHDQHMETLKQLHPETFADDAWHFGTKKDDPYYDPDFDDDLDEDEFDRQITDKLVNPPDDNTIRQLVEQGWKEGTDGKALELPDGSRLEWTPDEHGSPHHDDVLKDLKWHPEDCRYMYINPDGTAYDLNDLQLGGVWNF